jgi:hypothetical protein
MEELTTIKENFIQIINGIVKNHKISHAYLVEVNNYEEDLQYVTSFIKMILCDLSYDELKNSDNPIIHLIDSGNFPDIRVVSSDTSVINKSLILDLQKEFNNKSLLDGKRFYIIEEAEKLNGYSANTILKFLEEPEDDIIAFLLTDNRYHVLDTIISRCQVLSLKDDTSTYHYDDQLLDFIDCIIHPKNFFIKYNYYVKEVFLDKNIVKEYLENIENIFITYMEDDSQLNEEIHHLLCDMDSYQLIHILSILEDELPKLDFNVNFKLWLDSLFSKLIGG